MFIIRKLTSDNLKIYAIQAIMIIHIEYRILIIPIVLNCFVAWKYGNINAKNTLSKKVLITTSENNNLLSTLKAPPVHINIAIRKAFDKNIAIFNCVCLGFAFDETSIYSANPKFANINQNPAMFL